MKICIKNGLIIDPIKNLQQKGTLWVEDGIIKEISTNAATEQPDGADTITIDAEGKWVVPGLIDLHVHFREPGFEYKEDIRSGCEAAAKGGFTTVCCMPNTNPVIDNRETVTYILEKSKAANGVHVLPVGAITKSQEGKTLADFENMLAAGSMLEASGMRGTGRSGRGICGISEDGKTVEDTGLMAKGMETAKKLDLTVFSHAEPEEEIVKRDILLAEEIGCRLHFCHISTKESLEAIRKAKEKGLFITAETAPHYFTLEESQVCGDPNKKMNPPLRTKDDRQAVLEALKDGTLDIIATDHAPHHRDEKNQPYDMAPNGVTGLETSFAVSYTKLVKTGLLTPLDLITKMSSRPAEILKINKGSLTPGEGADIVIIDVENAYLIQADEFASKASNSPFNDMEVYGRIDCTIVDGRMIWKREEVQL